MESVNSSRVQFVTNVPRLPARAGDANKGDCGKIVIIGGSRGMAGAPCLAARGAYRGGAGLVRAAVPSSIWDVVAIKLDECLTEGFGKPGAASFSKNDFSALQKSCEWGSVVVIGPGMGQNPSTVDLIQKLVKEIDRPLVLDADALNSFRDSKIKLLQKASERMPARQVVLTPHPGEMARLLGILPRDVQADRLNVTLDVAQATKAVVVLKGAGTLVCDGKRIYENHTGNAGMATGGSGDVLSGLIGALMGQGQSAFDAACLGVFLHGLAGDFAAKRLGEWSLMAGDLVGELPNAFLSHAGAT